MVQIKRTNDRFVALVIGASLVIMATAAGIAYGYLHPLLFSQPAIPLSVQHLVRLNLALWAVIIVTDILVSWGVYRFFRNRHEKLARAAGLLRLVYTAFLVVAVGLLARAGSAVPVTEAVHGFERVWTIGLVLFGAHLLLLGVVIVRSTTVPRALGWLIGAAGIAYSATSSLRISGSRGVALAGEIEQFIAVPMALAEILLALWMLVHAARTSPGAAATAGAHRSAIET
jgi:hypothetical protein